MAHNSPAVNIYNNSIRGLIMKLQTLMVGVALTIAAPLAIAEGSGYYGALDLGQSNFKDMCTGFSGSCKSTDTAFRVALG